MFELLLYFVGFSTTLTYSTEEAAKLSFQNILHIIKERRNLKDHIILYCTDEFNKTIYFPSDKLHGAIVRPKEVVDNLRLLQISWYEEAIKELQEKSQGDSWKGGYDKPE
jgi:hypothetical protein